MNLRIDKTKMRAKNILRFSVVMIILVSCRPEPAYEIISTRENMPTFVATVYAPDTLWTEMEQFARLLIRQKNDKKYNSYFIGFYSKKDKTPKFDAKGIPIVKSFEEASHAQDFLVATYDFIPGDSANAALRH